MREIEFLPSWYPQIHRRYRALLIQGWVTFGVLSLLIGVAIAKRYQSSAARKLTQQCQAQISKSQEQLVQLAEMMKYESKLRRQDEIVARLGLGVDATRLLKSLEEAMTPEMALTGMSLETVESLKPDTVPVATARNAMPGRDFAAMDRRLKVVVDGVAPTDMQLATLLENLSRVRCFENVAFNYFREGRSRDGHVLREFEITFELNINPPSEGKI